MTDRGRTLVVVSNRLPVRRSDDGWQLSAGGLVTALQPLMARRPGVWIGADGGDPEVPERVSGMAARLRPVALSDEQVAGHYAGFSNRTLWPLLHDLVEEPVIDQSWWQQYREVNQVFADAVVAAVEHDAQDGDLVLWVHDYHLLLLPGLLRQRLPRLRIGFFLHIPWPPPELFARLPWRQELLEGMLGADVVSFHTEWFRANFARSASRILDQAEVAVRGDVVELADGRRVRTLAKGISIDADDFAARARSEVVEQHLGRLGEQFHGRRVLLGVDRLDYTKGILERLEGFERLLSDVPDLRDELVMVQIAVPSRGSVEEYQDLRSAVEETIGRINGRFTSPGGDVPVHYLHRGVDRDQLLAYYRLADTMLVTPLKDGMNLVAKEFVVCQHATDGTGALVLSEFTGSSLALTDAVTCNPFDIDGLARQIRRALELPAEERRRRLDRMAASVHDHDVFDWLDRELDALGSTDTADSYPAPTRHHDRSSGG